LRMTVMIVAEASYKRRWMPWSLQVGARSIARLGGEIDVAGAESVEILCILFWSFFVSKGGL